MFLGRFGHMVKSGRDVPIEEVNFTRIFVEKEAYLDIHYDSDASFYYDKYGFIIVEGIIYNKVKLCKAVGLKTSIGYGELIYSLSHKLGAHETFRRLDGKFAIVLFSKDNGELFLAVDRFGEKKLSYSLKNDIFWFSTSSSAIARSSKQGKIDRNALGMYFVHNYICAPFTIFENIKKVSPGENVQFGRQGIIQQNLYFDVTDIYLNEKVELSMKLGTAEANVEEALKSSVKKRLRMMEGGHTALFLSGGIDSCLLGKVLSEMDEAPITAYTASFVEGAGKYDESQAAKIIASHYGLEHKVVPIEGELIKRSVDWILGGADEPMANKTYPIIAWLMQSADADLKCVFTGDGGDELFWGYPLYQRINRMQMLYMFTYPFSRIISKSERILPEKLSNVYSALREFPPEQFLQYNTAHSIKGVIKKTDIDFSYPDMNKVSSRWFKGKNMIDLYYGTQAAIRKWNDLASANGMIHFSPMLDVSVVSVSAKLKDKFKIKRNDNKVILRKMVSRDIQEIGNLPKHGFGVPVSEWLKGSFRERLDYYTDKTFVDKQNLFDFDMLTHMKERFLNGTSNYIYNTVAFMWDYFVFQIWYEAFCLQENKDSNVKA